MRNSLLLGLTTLTVVFSGLSAQAETVESTNSKAIASHKGQGLANRASQSHAKTVAINTPFTVSSDAVPTPGKFATSASALVNVPAQNVALPVAQVDRTTPGSPTSPNTPGTLTPDPTSPTQPTPGTITPDTTTPTTPPGTLTPDPTSPNQTTPPGTYTPDTTTPTTPPGTYTPDTTTPTTPTTPDTTTPTTPTTPSSDGISPGRSTRSGSSYFGIGGNIGLGTGDTAIGDGSFVVFSKIGLTRNFSVRPSVFVSEDPTLLLPITYDLAPRAIPGTNGLGIAPYLGAGAAVSFGDDTSADFLLTGGVDVPLSPRFTATAAINATPFDNAAVGLSIGIGYNFSGF
ncbi:hypothetical protein [Iningainema tapete]|uniref:Outer membrane protein beta-barrel domain-containing protein n=1 Tax=Iningainema tapete BLCC-T55 TaxID=2748662 RepID=A0A8J6XM14_9CYAN|nr:hypothetical protein [Iningainema tapete]MBD2778914.1 hypothetical protein [Iningainema tapete BLCC-T55]